MKREARNHENSLVSFRDEGERGKRWGSQKESTVSLKGEERASRDSQIKDKEGEKIAEE